MGVKEMFASSSKPARWISGLRLKDDKIAMNQSTKTRVGKILITGGRGRLAAAIVDRFDFEYEVCFPSKEDLDVSDPFSVNAYFGSLDELDLLVCNAGLIRDALLFKMKEEEWDRVLNVHLKGAFLCARAALKIMLKKRSGHIIFIGSYSGFHPPLGQINYGSAKAGLVGLVKTLAVEVGGQGIRANLIVPGWMKSKMTDAVSDKKRAEVLSQHCLGKWNTPEAVAEFLFTLETKMKQTSGQIFHLDSRILP